MTNKDKGIVWCILNKYEGTLTSLCDSFSNVVQGTSDRSDYINIFLNYRFMETNDMNVIDSLIGKEIIKSVN